MANYCLACGSCMLQIYFSPGDQPLAALALPETREEALHAKRYPMEFLRCMQCGHIFNARFSEDLVPYNTSSNLMYNDGGRWDKHLENVVDYIIGETLCFGKTVVDIGAGDGRILRQIKKRSAKAGIETRCVAFEPSPESSICQDYGLETRAAYFDPACHVNEYLPDVVICRHVLEHMGEPRAFVTALGYYLSRAKQYADMILEVPCIEHAVKTKRISDFLYEHVSNFTRHSLHDMMSLAGWVTSEIYTDYNNEVIIWRGYPSYSSFGFDDAPIIDIEETRRELEAITSVWRTVYWGGTGKSCSFLNTYKQTEGRVVDSDERKAGKYVPGTGQLIEHASVLEAEPVDAIVITTRWRAADIYSEIKQRGIQVEKIYIVECGVVKIYTEEMYEKEKK